MYDRGPGDGGGADSKLSRSGSLLKRQYSMSDANPMGGKDGRTSGDPRDPRDGSRTDPRGGAAGGRYDPMMRHHDGGGAGGRGEELGGRGGGRRGLPPGAPSSRGGDHMMQDGAQSKHDSRYYSDTDVYDRDRYSERERERHARLERRYSGERRPDMNHSALGGAAMRDRDARAHDPSAPRDRPPSRERFSRDDPRRPRSVAEPEVSEPRVRGEKPGHEEIWSTGEGKQKIGGPGTRGTRGRRTRTRGTREKWTCDRGTTGRGT